MVKGPMRGTECHQTKAKIAGATIMSPRQLCSLRKQSHNAMMEFPIQYALKLPAPNPPIMLRCATFHARRTGFAHVARVNRVTPSQFRNQRHPR
jgi:hypothetical protein